MVTKYRDHMNTSVKWYETTCSYSITKLVFTLRNLIRLSVDEQMKRDMTCPPKNAPPNRDEADKSYKF